MKKPDFVYVTYIATTPEKVWQAFVDTNVMAQYWVGSTAACARVNVSDWKPGSKWEHQHADDASAVDIVGKVVESNPPRRLVFTWARPTDAEDESKHSRVAIDIEPQGDGLVRLTVTHEDLARDPQMLAGISGGWPKVLSNLKTLLETGRALPRPPSVG
ncbi:SRPBCC family protein [Rhodoferax ferrireducens]|uniref:SRPBCC family protein n=1 Tax=Rhodoferax ferrireducens TaxID=192843 RepID=UPI000E0CF154|nr:SRPBCC family protein [Rhodoferax ferrireducens]